MDIAKTDNDQIRVRLDKLGRLRQEGATSNPYRNGLKPNALSAQLHKEHDSKSKEDLESKNLKYSVAGRLMAIRSFGKAAFLQLRDRSGKIQLFIQKKAVGDDVFVKYKDLDVGDIIFADGHLFKTKTGELTLEIEKFSLLTKSLRPLPEKYHGIADVEIKYRQRYLDLIMSEDTKKIFRMRTQIISSIRNFFNARDFLEVETPMMHPLVGGATARPFKTHHNTLDMELFLRIAPELYLKRLVVGGFDRVFEINRNFRNEGVSIKHNPEFTMIEFYQAYATYEDLMDLTQNLFQNIAKDLFKGGTTLTYQGKEINLGGKWERLSVEDAIVKYSGFTEKNLLRDRKALIEYGHGHKIHMDEKDSLGKIMMAIFDEEVEEKLIQPVFITHYPLDVSPLSRKNEKDPFLVDRFELFVNGWEMANAFSELNDPMDQRERFQAQVDAKAAGDEEACDMDEDYITALEYGMPPTAGQGIGIDRMTMLFTDSASIRDVILFPQLRAQKQPESPSSTQLNGSG